MQCASSRVYGMNQVSTEELANVSYVAVISYDDEQCAAMVRMSFL